MKLAALATSFVIGFISGVSLLPVPSGDVQFPEFENQRRFDVVSD